MSQQSDIAFAHQQQRIQIQHQAQGRVAGLWAAASVNGLDASWDALAPAMVAQVTAAQIASAALAIPYMDAMSRSYNDNTPSVDLAPEAFGGVMLDGREVGPAMYTAVTTAKTGIRGGMAPYNAFQAGANALSVVIGAAIQDMGRQADITMGNAKTYTAYVRVCSGSACSRCAILAGSWSGQTAFLRHTCCQCSAAPVEVTKKGDKIRIPDGFHASPDAYFDSLSKEEQDKRFTKAGAEAIRNGADPIKVVNARRGAYGIGYSGHYNTPVPVGTRGALKKVTIGRKPDGSPLQVYATTEGTSYRGEFGRSEYRAGVQAAKEGRYRRTTSLRLMPEQIIQMAGGNPTRLRELLRRYGYLY
jgi:hypothetical protein